MPDPDAPDSAWKKGGEHRATAEGPLFLLPLEGSKWPPGAAAATGTPEAAAQMGASRQAAHGKGAMAIATLALLAAIGIGGQFWLQKNPDSERLPTIQARDMPRAAVVPPSAMAELHIAAPASTTGAPAARQARSAPVRQPVATVLMAAPKPTINPALARGYEHLIAGDADGARREYELLLRLEPNNADALHGMAAIALRQGQADVAEGHFARALEADPKDALALAGLLALMGRTDPVPSEAG